jgi:hypothetical protein
MHPAMTYEPANAWTIDLRRQARRDALARAARHPTEPAPIQLTANGARCQALLASGLQRSDAPGPTVWRRRSGPPWRGSVPAAAHSGWLRSSATTPRQPPSACGGCVRY